MMAARLINIIMSDGSRHFGDLPESIDWHQLRDHIKLLAARERFRRRI